MDRTTIRLRPDLMDRARAFASAHDASFTKVVENALEQYLAATPARRKPKSIRFKTAGGDGFVGGGSYEQALARAQDDHDRRHVGGQP